jgi:GSCFA family
MKFHLNFKPAKPNFDITHQDKLVLIGSCFSENIGAILEDHQFNVLSNPTGILFNPLSIAKLLEEIIHLTKTDKSQFIKRAELYYSYLCHSSIHETSSDALAEKINTLNQSNHHALKKANVLVITFGTAYYYKLNENNQLIANCHKQPGTLFTKRLATVEEITSHYEKLVKTLIEFNPNLKLIFTVSPVKHLRDGLIENNMSKATLLLAINKLTSQQSNCFYFPAYELVNDDLRDHRFYKEDLAHPNELAIKYVWDKFSDTYFNPATKELTTKIHQLNLALKHKNTTSNTEEERKHQQYIENLQREIKTACTIVK